MERWIPKPSSIPSGDGAFERFLSAAIAAIITIMFSWRLLDRLTEEEEREVQERGNGIGSAGILDETEDASATPLTSSSSSSLLSSSVAALSHHQALPVSARTSASVPGRRQLPALPTSKSRITSALPHGVRGTDGVMYNITDLKPFIRVPVDLPLCGDILSDPETEDGDGGEEGVREDIIMLADRVKVKEQKRKVVDNDILDSADGVNLGSSPSAAKERRLSEETVAVKVKANSSATEPPRYSPGRSNAIDLPSSSPSPTPADTHVESDQYSKHGVLSFDSHSTTKTTSERAHHRVLDPDHNASVTHYDSCDNGNRLSSDSVSVSDSSVNITQEDAVVSVIPGTSSSDYTTPIHDHSSEDLIDSSCDDILGEVDSKVDRFFDISADSGSYRFNNINNDDEDDDYVGYPLREVNDRVRVVGRSRDDSDIDYAASYVIDDDEDEFYITSPVGSSPHQRVPRLFQRHFSDDYEDEDDDNNHYDDDDEYEERGMYPREYDVDEEMYCSTLEPIMEEDSDDISTSGSEVDRSNFGKVDPREETSFEEKEDNNSSTHFSVPSLTSAPLRYALSSSSSSLPSSFKSAPAVPAAAGVMKRNLAFVDNDSSLLPPQPPLSRSVGRTCDLDKAVHSDTPHLNTTSLASVASPIHEITTTSKPTHDEGEARGSYSYAKPDYRTVDNRSSSTHLGHLQNTEESDTDTGKGDRSAFDRSHLDQYKIHPRDDYFDNIRNFGSSVDYGGDNNNIVIPIGRTHQDLNLRNPIPDVSSTTTTTTTTTPTTKQVGTRHVSGQPRVTDSIPPPPFREVSGGRDRDILLRDQCVDQAAFTKTKSFPPPATAAIQSADDFSNSESDESVQTVIGRRLSSDSSSGNNSNSNNSPSHGGATVSTLRLSPVKSTTRPLSDSYIYTARLKGESPEGSAFDRGRIVSEGGAVSIEEEQSQQLEERGGGFDLRAYKSYDNLVDSYNCIQSDDLAGDLATRSASGDYYDGGDTPTTTPSCDNLSLSPNRDRESSGPGFADYNNRVNVGGEEEDHWKEGEINKAWNSSAASKHRGHSGRVAASLRDFDQDDVDCVKTKRSSIVGNSNKNRPSSSGEEEDELIDAQSNSTFPLQSKLFSSIADSDNHSFTDQGKTVLLPDGGEFNEEVSVDINNEGGSNNIMDYRRGDQFGRSPYSRSGIDDRYGRERGGGREENEEEEEEEDDDWEDNNVVEETFIIPKTPESHIIKTLQNVKHLLDQKSTASSRSSLYHPSQHGEDEEAGGGALEPMDFDQECQSTCSTTVIEVTGHDAMGFHGDDDETSGYRGAQNALTRTDRDLKGKMGFQLDMDEFKLEDYNTDSGWPIVRYFEKERVYVDEDGYDTAQDFADVDQTEEEMGDDKNDKLPSVGFNYPSRGGEYHPGDEDDITDVAYGKPTEYIDLMGQNNEYIDPRTLGKVYIEPRTQHDEYIDPRSQGKAYIEPRSQGKSYIDPPTQHDEYIDPRTQHDEYIDPRTQHDEYNDPMTQNYDYNKDGIAKPSEYMDVRKETEFPGSLALETFDEEPQKKGTWTPSRGRVQPRRAQKQQPQQQQPQQQQQQQQQQQPQSQQTFVTTESAPRHEARPNQPPRPNSDMTPQQRSVNVEASPVLSLPPPSFSSSTDNRLQDLAAAPKHSTLSQQAQSPTSTKQPDAGFHAFFRGIPSLATRDKGDGYDDFVRQISEADEESQPLSEPDASSPTFPRPLDSAILSGNLASPHHDKFLFPEGQLSPSAAEPGTPGFETSSPLEKAGTTTTTTTTPARETSSIDSNTKADTTPTTSVEGRDMAGYKLGVRKSSTCSVFYDESNNVLNASFDDSEMSGLALERYDSEPGIGISRSRSRDSITDSPRSAVESPTREIRAPPPPKTLFTPRSAPTVSTEPALDVVLENPSPKTKNAPSSNVRELPLSSSGTKIHSRSPITAFSYVPVPDGTHGNGTSVPDTFGDAAVEITSSSLPPAGPRALLKRSFENPETYRRPETGEETQSPNKYKRQEEHPYTERNVTFNEMVKKPALSSYHGKDFIKPMDVPQIRPVLQHDMRFDPVVNVEHRPDDERGMKENSDDDNDNEKVNRENYDIRGKENYSDSHDEEDDDEEEEDDEEEDEEDSEEEESESMEDDDDDEEEEENQIETEKSTRQEVAATYPNIFNEKPLEKKETTLEASSVPTNSSLKPGLGQTRIFSYSVESGEDIYPPDSSSGSHRTSPVMSSDSASVSALESAQPSVPVPSSNIRTSSILTKSLPSLSLKSPSSIITTPSVTPSQLKGSAWAHSQFVPNSGHPKPKTMRELKKKYKPYKSILTQEPTSPSTPPPRLAPFELPSHLITPSRLRVLYSRDKFLSEQNLDADASMEGEFETRKTALLSQEMPDSDNHKGRRYTPHAKLQSKYNSQEQLQRLKNMIKGSPRRKSESALHKQHECLHDHCILSEEGRREIIDQSLSIDNLHADIFLNLRRLASEGDAGALGDAYFPETESDLYDLTFPMQNYNNLERPASMSELRHASGYSTISGAAAEMNTPRAGSTGKGRFAHRQNKKSKSLCTLETNLDDDDDPFDLSMTEDGMKRVPSVHELRISKSLQKLNVPDWYKHSGLSKSGSCLLKYGSSSTMSSYQFSPSLVSSRCTTPSASSNVVIKTRVITPTSARNLRSPRFPSSVSAPTTPSGEQPNKSVRLPTDKYRNQEKSKSLMPIPIVPFDRIRAMFEKKNKKPSSSSNKDKISATTPPTSPTTKSPTPPSLSSSSSSSLSSTRPPNTLALNGRRDYNDDDDDDDNNIDMSVPKIIVSPTDPHVKSILKRPNQEKRYSDIQEAGTESEEEPTKVFQPTAASYPSHTPTSPDVSFAIDTPVVHSSLPSASSKYEDDYSQIPVIDEFEPAAQQTHYPSQASAPVNEPVIKIAQRSPRESAPSLPKVEPQAKRETAKSPIIATSTKKGDEEKNSKSPAPVAKPRGFNFFKSLRSLSSSSSEDAKEKKGRKSAGSSLNNSLSPQQSPNSSYDSSGFPASPQRKIESPDQHLSPVSVPVSHQAPPPAAPKPSISKEPEHLMALAAGPKAPSPQAQTNSKSIANESYLDDAPPVRISARNAQIEDSPIISPPPPPSKFDSLPRSYQLEEAPTVRPPPSANRNRNQFEELQQYERAPVNVKRLEEFPPSANRNQFEELQPYERAPIYVKQLEVSPPLANPNRNQFEELQPYERAPVNVKQLEESPSRRPPEPRHTPSVPSSSRHPAYETNLDDTLDKIEKRLQEPEKTVPPKPAEKKKWMPKPKGFRFLKSAPEPSKSPTDKNKKPPAEIQRQEVPDLQTKFKVNEMSSEPRRLRSSVSSGLNESMRSEDGYGRGPHHSLERPYTDLDKSRDSRPSLSSMQPRDLDERMRRPSEDSTRSYPREDRIQGRAATRDLDRSATRNIGNRSLDRNPQPPPGDNNKERTWRPKDLDRRAGSGEIRDRDHDRRDVMQNLERREPSRESGSRGGPPQDRREARRSLEIREPSRERDELPSYRDPMGSISSIGARDLPERNRTHSVDRRDNHPAGSSFNGSSLPRRPRPEEDWSSHHQNNNNDKGKWQPKPRASRGDTGSLRSLSNINGASNSNLYRYPVEGSAFSSTKPNTAAGLATPPPQRKMEGTPQKSAEGGAGEPKKNMRETTV